MATKNEIDSDKPIEVSKGGTGKVSFTSYAPICGGTTATGALQNTATAGLASDLLNSTGAGALPEFVAPITYFEQLGADPGSPTAGDVWYNTVTDLFKGAISAGNVWWYKANAIDSGDNRASSGTVDDAFGCRTTVAQRYDGIGDSWSSKTAIGGVPDSDHLGTGTSGGDCLLASKTNGTSAVGTTSRYDGVGDSWSSKTNMNTAVASGGITGDADDVLYVSGRTNPLTGWTTTTLTQRYDGVGDSWANKATITTGTELAAATGTGVDGLLCGGRQVFAASAVTVVERYDGAGDSWTSKTGMGIARNTFQNSGPASDAIVWGGRDKSLPPNFDSSEIYDGAGDSWSVGPTLNTARMASGMGGPSSSSALTWSGKDAAGASTLTTEQLGGGTLIVTFTVT